MSATWPAELDELGRDLLARNYTETPNDPVIRTEMEVGRPKSRRRSTVADVKINGEKLLTSAQKATLNGFWKVDCAMGSLPFNWGRKSVGVVKRYRWLKPPTFSSRSGLWVARLELEMLD